MPTHLARHLLTALEASLRRLGPTTSTCGSCTPGTGARRWRRRCRRWTRPSPAARSATSGCRTTRAGRPRRPRRGRPRCPAGRRSCPPRWSTRCCSAASSARWCPRRSTLGMGVLPWSPLGRGVLTGKYRTGTPADSRGASPHFSNVRRAVPRTEATPSRRRGGHRRRRAGRLAARGRAGLGARPARRGRPDPGRPDRGPAEGRAAVEALTLPAEIRSALDDVSEPAKGIPRARLGAASLTYSLNSSSSTSPHSTTSTGSTSSCTS